MARSLLDPVYRSRNAPLLVFPPLASEDRDKLMRDFRRMKMFDEYQFIPCGSLVAGIRTRKIVVLPWREVCGENRALMERITRWLRDSVYCRLLPRGEFVEL